MREPLKNAMVHFKYTQILEIQECVCFSLEFYHDHTRIQEIQECVSFSPESYSNHTKDSRVIHFWVDSRVIPYRALGRSEDFRGASSRSGP